MHHTPRRVILDMPLAISEASHPMLWQRCIHWAATQPDKIALVTPDAAYSYLQLNQTINRVAGAVLQVRDKLGNQPLRVLLLFDDPFQLVASLVGVEKAGACQVTLNSATPAAFLKQISQETEPGLILTQPSLSARAGELVPADVAQLTLDSLPPWQADHEPRGECSIDDLHSILYTSGSSGRPKGVMRSRWFESFNVARDLGSNLTLQSDRALCTAALSSGLGYRYVRNVLVVGATAYVPNLHGDWMHDARRWLNDEKITLLGTLPSIQRTLLGQDHSQKVFESLEIISTGGEGVLANDFESFKRHCASGALFSVIYGASEGGIYSLEFLTHESKITTPAIPLGRPLGLVEITVVDEQLNRLPPDQVGEILVRSPMTAEGYWKMPELTAKKFLPDPDGGRRRIYRTGDAGKISADGTITFLGRLDDEVKVNGNRVSLPLIEDTLRTCPGVKNVTVQPHTRSSDGGTNLAGYYVAAPEDITGGTILREYLQQRLPGYMIPSHFIRLDVIPLNAHGKVDRFALPPPDETSRTIDERFVSPRTEVERKIAGIWSEILGVEKIGVNDRFSDLGGDSLQAIKMLLEVNRVLQTTLDIPALNHVRTIAEIAAILEAPASAHRYPAMALLREGTGPPLFLLPAVAGNVLLYQQLVSGLSGAMPIYGLLAKGLNRDEKPLTSVPAIARHHLQVMKSVQPHGPYYFGGYSFGGVIAYEIAQQLRAAGEQVGLYFAIDIRVRLPKSLTMAQKIQNRIQLETRRVFHHVRYFATHWPSEWGPYTKELFRRADRVRRNAALRRELGGQDNEVVDRYLAEVDEIASEEISAVIDANHLALSKHRPIPYAGDVVVLLAQETNFEGMEAWKSPWRQAVQGRLEFIEVPGNHRSMMSEPHVTALANRLNPVLARSFATSSDQAARSPLPAPFSPPLRDKS